MNELEELAERLRTASLTAQGTTDQKLRHEVHAFAQGICRNKPVEDGLDPDLAAFVNAVTAHSNEANVVALAENGRSDDQIFEIAVVAAVAAGLSRMELGLSALRDK